ncbi:16079_t:CDS:2, partial [Acaulospora morrowiae]
NKDDVITSEEDAPISFLKHPIIWIENMISVIVRTGRVNLLLVFFIPAVLMKHYDSNKVLLTIFNFLAIVPLSNLMTTGLDDLTARIGPAYASVLHALSGNFVELFIECYALADKRYAIVRSAILGAILCSITFVSAS